MRAKNMKLDKSDGSWDVQLDGQKVKVGWPASVTVEFVLKPPVELHLFNVRLARGMSSLIPPHLTCVVVRCRVCSQEPPILKTPEVGEEGH